MKRPRIVSSEFIKNNLDNPKSFSGGVLSLRNDLFSLFIQPIEEREREIYEMNVLADTIALVKMVALSRKNIEGGEVIPSDLVLETLRVRQQDF